MKNYTITIDEDNGEYNVRIRYFDHNDESVVRNKKISSLEEVSKWLLEQIK